LLLHRLSYYPFSHLIISSALAIGIGVTVAAVVPIAVLIIYNAIRDRKSAGYEPINDEKA